jgi:hypothetical protein
LLNRALRSPTSVLAHNSHSQPRWRCRLAGVKRTSRPAMAASSMALITVRRPASPRGAARATSNLMAARAMHSAHQYTRAPSNRRTYFLERASRAIRVGLRITEAGERRRGGVLSVHLRYGTKMASKAKPGARSRARKPGRAWRAAETAARGQAQRRLRSAVGRQGKPRRLATEYRLYFTLLHLSTAAVPTLGSTSLPPT